MQLKEKGLELDKLISESSTRLGKDVSTATTAIGDAIGDVTGAIGGAISDVTSAVGDAVSSVTGGLTGATPSIGSYADDASASLTGGTTGGTGDICDLIPNLEIPADISGTGKTTQEIEERSSTSTLTLTQTPKEIISVQGKKSDQSFFTNIPDYPIRVNDFWIEYGPTNNIKQFYSDLSLFNEKGNEINRKIIFVNEICLPHHLYLFQYQYLICLRPKHLTLEVSELVHFLLPDQ